MKNVAIIFAGGTGQRMGGEIPKQFLKVCGKEIIIHTLELFENHESIDEIYVVCIESWISYLKELISRFGLDKVVRVVPGGSTGQDSIFIGLSEVKKDHDDAVVLIHDGVRPLVSYETIEKCVRSVEEYGSAITTTPCFETPLISKEGLEVEEMPARQIMRTAQAPQCFFLDLIYKVHLEERITNPTYEGIVDSCGLMFKHGYKSHLIEGNRGNIKVTTPEDYCTLIGNLNARDYEQLLKMENKNRVLKLESSEK